MVPSGILMETVQIFIMGSIGFLLFVFAAKTIETITESLINFTKISL